MAVIARGVLDTRKINGKALDADITLKISDLDNVETGTGNLMRVNGPRDQQITTNIAAAVTAHETKASDAHSTSQITGLDDAIAKGAESVLTVKWHPLRPKVWTGYAPADGQLLSRAMYPDAWAEVLDGNVPVCTEAEWLADPAKRVCYTFGDGSTTFRVPDYNGASAGAWGPAYLGGGSGGLMLRDRLQNITGSITTGNPIVEWGGPNDSVGALEMSQSKSPLQATSYTASVSNGYDRITFDASKVARTGDTTRPITAEGCWVIKLFGAASNSGSVDAASLAREFEELKKIAYSEPVLTSRWVTKRSRMWDGHVAADGQLLSRALYPDAWKQIQLGNVTAVSDAEWLADDSKKCFFSTGDGLNTFRVPNYNSSAYTEFTTCLVNAVGTGAPHETVSAGLPANIASNSRYVLQNPFGNNVPVEVWAEIKYNNMWSDPGFIFGNEGQRGYGTQANYVQGVGIVVQTGGSAVHATLSNECGSGFGATSGLLTSAPARVFVRRIDAAEKALNPDGCYAVKLFGAVQNAGVANAEQVMTKVAEFEQRLNVLEDRSTWTMASYMPDSSSANVVGPTHRYSSYCSRTTGRNPMTWTAETGWKIPQTGLYRISIQTTLHYVGGINVYINGNILQGSVFAPWRTDSNTGDGYSCTVITEMTANDIIDFGTSNTSFYDRRHWCITIERIA